LDHEDASVRQTALQILGQRLTAMSQGKRPGAEEVRLIYMYTYVYIHIYIRLYTNMNIYTCLCIYLCITEHIWIYLNAYSNVGIINFTLIYSIIQRALFLDLTSHLREAVRSSLPALSTPDNQEEDIEHDSLGIAQSALMCLDILARHLGIC
jgi:hypothetical protein